MLRINKLIGKNVNGYIPIDIVFYEDLTFLTGSNGSGKTTALKLISALLQPNYNLLNSIRFDEVTLHCLHDDEKIKISVKKIDSQGQFKFTSYKGRKKIKEIEETYNLYPDRSEYTFDREEYESTKEFLRSKFYDSEFYKSIDSLGNPVLLGIDRQIVGKSYDKRTLRRYRIRDSEISNISFRHAESELINYVSSKADEKRNLVEKLKADIFKTLFKYVSFTTINEGYNNISEKELKDNKKLTISTVKGLDLGTDILDEIETYFKNIEQLQKEINREDLDSDTKQMHLNEWWANRPHFSRIALVSEYAKKYQKRIDELDFPLREIVRITNSFFEESNKKLRIGANGRIYVDWTERDVSTNNLSSGEIQLIVIIIHLVFCELEKEHSVFVIDEPELSLHLSWQEKFVSAITSASPRTQFILATHSPAIISNYQYEEKCIVMKNV